MLFPVLQQCLGSTRGHAWWWKATSSERPYGRRLSPTIASKCPVSGLPVRELMWENWWPHCWGHLWYRILLPAAEGLSTTGPCVRFYSSAPLVFYNVPCFQTHQVSTGETQGQIYWAKNKHPGKKRPVAIFTSGVSSSCAASTSTSSVRSRCLHLGGPPGPAGRGW